MSQQIGSHSRWAQIHLLSGHLSVLAMMLTTVALGAFAQTHVTNPYMNAVGYVPSDYASEVASAISITSASATNPSYPSKNLQKQMATVALQPTAIWMDHIAAITATNQDGSSTGRKSLDTLIQEAVKQGTSSKPAVMEIVIYDLPDRDCAALASNGELSIAGSDIPKGGTKPLTDASGNTETGIQEYEHNYIDVIASVLSNYANNPAIRFVLVVEDDSLPNILTNSGLSFTVKNCVAANDGVTVTATSQISTVATPDEGIPMTGVYVEGISYALNTFHKQANVYNYLDIGHHGWLGWTSNMAYAVKFFNEFAQQLTDKYAAIDGIISNTANYGPTEEPFLKWNMEVGGILDTTASGSSTDVFADGSDSDSFYQWDPEIDEIHYTKDFYAALTSSVSAGYTDPRGSAHTPGGGFPSTLGFLIDTSRNGWGNLSEANGAGQGYNDSGLYKTRPTALGTDTKLDTFVAESKIDLRNSAGQWCNQENAGIGALPTFATSATVTNTGYDSTFPNLEAFVWIKPPGEGDGNYPGAEYYDPITKTTLPASTVGDPNCAPTTLNPEAGNDTEANTIPDPPPAGTFWIAEFTQLVQDAYPVLAETNVNNTYSISASPTTVAITAGGASGSTTITAANASGTPTYAVSTTLPTGVTATVSGSTVTFKASASAATSSTTVTIKGTDSASATATTTITLEVTASTTCSGCAVLTSPTNGSTLTGSTATFTWSAGTNVTAYKLILGTSAGGSDVYNSYTVTVLTKAVSAIPVTGATLYATLYSQIGGTWYSTTASYTEYKSTKTIAVLTSPAAGTTSISPTSNCYNFAWGSVSGATAYKLIVGTTAGGSTIYNSYTTTALSEKVCSLPTSGTIYVTLYTELSSVWYSNAYTFTIGTAPTLTISASPTTVTVAAGGSSASTTLTASGTSSSVTYAVTSTLPTGVTATVSGSSIAFSASTSASAGTTTVTIKGTSGSLTATTSISLVVTKAISGGCSAAYATSPQSSSAFGATLAITNNSTTASNSWTVTLTYANGQTVASGWNGVFTQSGSVVTVNSESYNGSIAAGATLSGIGFNGTWNGTTNSNPTITCSLK